MGNGSVSFNNSGQFTVFLNFFENFYTFVRDKNDSKSNFSITKEKNYVELVVFYLNKYIFPVPC